MSRRTNATLPAMATVGVLAFLVPCAGATVSDTVFTVQASNASGSGTYSATLADGSWDPVTQTFTWTLSAQIDILDDASGAWVASLTQGHVEIRATQEAQNDVSFAVTSGASDTTFFIASPLVSFPVIPSDVASGSASTSITLTDLGCDGALLVGLGPPGTGAFRSYYNGYLTDGDRFTHLLGVMYVSGCGTLTAGQADPQSGYRPFNADIRDLSSEIAFTLSAYDFAAALTFASSEQPPPVCYGDISRDGVIDFDDLAQLLASFGSAFGEPSYNAWADLDGSSLVDMSDLAGLLSVYGGSCP